MNYASSMKTKIILTEINKVQIRDRENGWYKKH